MDLPTRIIIGHFIIPLVVILCLGNAMLVETSPGTIQIGTRKQMLQMAASRVEQDETPYEEDYNDEDKSELKSDEHSMFVDACESKHKFVKMVSGINPDSRLVQLYPSTYVYTTRCRTHQFGKSCRGLDGIDSVCRPKKSWVQVYGRLVNEQSSWQQHWIAVGTSCSCLVKTPFSTFIKEKSQ